MGDAWSEGWALGERLQGQRQEHKQALSDMELQGKAQRYASEIDNLQKKAASLPKDSREYQETFDALQDTLHNVRELFHPDKNPGMIDKFGHLITDSLKITNPAQRQTAQGAKQDALISGDRQQAQGLIAAGPLTPEQQGTLKGQEQAAMDLAVFNGNMKMYDSQYPEGVGPNATPEGKQARAEYANDLLMSGLKEPKPVAENFIPEEIILADGRRVSAQRDTKSGKHEYLTGKPIPEELLDGAKIASTAKPGTSVFSVSLDTYAKSKGYGSFGEIPDEYKEKVKDYEIRKGVLDRTISRKSIVTKIMQDAEGHPFTATVTNYSGPAGNMELVDPMPMKQGAEPPPSGSTIPTPQPANPTATSPNLDKVKKGAKALNTPPSGGGNATYGAPDTSIQMKTPGITKLGEQHDAAVELVSEAQDAVANPNNGEMQFLLVDNLLHGALGRVNEIEIKRIQDRGGWFLAPERWEAEAKSGTMAPELVKQLYDFTLSQQKAIEKAQSTHGNTSDVKNKANKLQFPDAPDIGAVEEDNTTHKKYAYKGGDWHQQSNWEEVKQ